MRRQGVGEQRVSEGPRLASDSRGAVMLVGIFMAVFLAAMLYYVVGIGDAVLFQERSQDAADAAALSAAVMHARGMNLIVLINIIMAALVTVLLALKLLLTLIDVAILAVVVIAFVSGGSASAALPSLYQMRRAVSKTHDAYQKTAYQLLRVLHKTERGVRVVTPATAHVAVLREVLTHYDPPAAAGFVLPQRTTLPVEDDDFGRLCEKAGENLAGLSLRPLKRVLPGSVVSSVEDAAGGLAGSLSSYFCGGGGSAPSYVQKMDEVYPRTAAMAGCVREAEGEGSSVQDSKVCTQAQRDSQEGKPDARGSCPTGRDCSDSGAYAKLRRAARVQCNPAKRSGLRKFRWQETKVREVLTWDGTQWESKRRESLEERVVEGRRPPCGDGGVVAKGWESEMGSMDEPNPLCAEAPQLPVLRAKGTTVEVSYRQVTQLLSCVRKVERRFTMDEVQPVQGSTSDMAPQRVEQDRTLGDDAFQQRAVVFRRSRASRPDRLVELASWGECQGHQRCAGQLASATSLLTRLSVAQAEYFYEGTESRPEWMWNMAWKARLVRFRLGAEKKKGTGERKDPDIQRFGGLSPARNLGQACRRGVQSGGSCGEAQGIIEQLSRIVLH